MKRPLAVLAGTVSAVVLSTAAAADSANPVVGQPVAQAAAQLVLPVAQAGVAPMVLFAQAGSSTNDALMLLLDQFQALRSEMEMLRGMVEEHSFEIRRLQRDSLDRYTDLDGRISALYQDLEAGGAAAAPSAAAPAVTAAPAAGSNQTAITASAAPQVQSSAPAAAAVTLGSNVAAGGLVQDVQPPVMLTEQQLYELALDALLQREEYQGSIQQFDQYLAQYPNGRFVTNAHYWKGQAFVNLSMFAEARDSFEIILTQYPDGRKIEDAMYSLGTVYHRLGDTSRARQLLQDVRTRFPNTSAANLADIYLRTLN